jgi:streptomycin 6-kinase
VSVSAPPVGPYDSADDIKTALDPMRLHGQRAYDNAQTILNTVTGVTHVTEEGPQYG